MALHKHSVISVAKHFSRYPAGVSKADSDRSGEAFREILVTKLRENDSVQVLLDGTGGFASNWLEEVFHGLVAKDSFTSEDLHKRLTVHATDESLVIEVWAYMNDPERNSK